MSGENSRKKGVRKIVSLDLTLRAQAPESQFFYPRVRGEIGEEVGCDIVCADVPEMDLQMAVAMQHSPDPCIPTATREV
jgi:hypothetical protein